MKKFLLAAFVVLFLMALAVAGGFALLLANGQTVSITEIEPEVAPAIVPTPTPTAVPSPEEEAVEWHPGNEYHDLLTKADFAEYSVQVIAACGNQPDGTAGAPWVIVSPPSVENGVKFDCQEYIEWVIGESHEYPASGAGNFFSEEYFVEQVEAAHDENTNEESISPTPAPTAVPTEEPTVEEETITKPMTDTLDLLVTDWFTATNVPTQVVSIKVNNTGGWNLVPKSASIMLDDEGVLGADNGNCNGNLSCIDTSGADHNQAQGLVVYDTVPEGSFWTAWADSFNMTIAGYNIDIDSCGSDCAWGLLVRGWHLETHEDRHAGIQISDYGTPGAMKYTRYPVPAGYGQFFSEDYFTDQGLNALTHDNCGIGLQDGIQDCEKVMAAVFDINDGSLTILSLNAETGTWDEVWTNVVAYGRDAE